MTDENSSSLNTGEWIRRRTAFRLCIESFA